MLDPSSIKPGMKLVPKKPPSGEIIRKGCYTGIPWTEAMDEFHDKELRVSEIYEASVGWMIDFEDTGHVPRNHPVVTRGPLFHLEWCHLPSSGRVGAFCVPCGGYGEHRIGCPVAPPKERIAS